MQVLKESNEGKAPNGFLLILGKNNMPDFAKSQVLRPHISDETDQIRILMPICFEREKGGSRGEVRPRGPSLPQLHR